MKFNHAVVQVKVTVIYSRAILVAVRQECNVKRVICKTWTGTLANITTQIRRRRTRRLIWVFTVCLSYRKLIFKWNSLMSPFRTIFPAYTQTINPPVLSVLWYLFKGFAGTKRKWVLNRSPSKHTTQEQRCNNVAATSWRCSDVITTLYVC